MGILPNSLIKNNGDGTFTDVTISSGIYAAFPTQSAVWLDINTDGWLDLFVGNETHNRQDIHPCQLWLNQKDGSFTDVAPKLGLNFQIYVKGVATGDINNDGLPDLYISSINGPNKLLANRGGTNPDDWVFEDITEKAGVAEPLESFPAWFFDYNNDGWDDLFVSSFDKFSLNQQSREVAADYLGITSNSDWPRLYRNEGGEQFSDQTQSTSLRRILPTMGCNFGDLDNDGFLDFYLGTGAPDYRAIVPNRMFRNNAGQSFQDVTSAGNFGHIQKGHGIAFADLDNDGDKDIYAVMGGSLSGDIFPNALFENPGNENKWLILRLEGTHSNRSAIGAKIRIDLQEENGSKRQVFVTVNSGGSFGANSLQQEIGLGEAVKISNIAINWPDGKPTYTDYGEAVSNKAYRIKEGENQLEIIECKPFKFIKDLHSTGHHH